MPGSGLGHLDSIGKSQYLRFVGFALGLWCSLGFKVWGLGFEVWGLGFGV